MTTEKINIYDEVTQKIIAALEDGVTPWTRSWKSLGALRNAVSGRPYRGINTLLLSISSFAQGFGDPRWLTFKNAEQLGGKVKKGQKGTMIVFWKFVTKAQEGEETFDGEDNEDGGGKKFAFARRYTVFNVEQCEGLKIEALTLDDLELELEDNELNEQAEAIMALPKLHHGGDRACYMPSTDQIFMPPRSSFESLDHYYATGFHEICHWTKAPSRLDRDFKQRFKGVKEARAMEELVAEIGAAFLGAHTGVHFEGMQHPEYIGSWIKVFQDNNKAIFTAASHAQKAADFIVDQAGLLTLESNLPAAAMA